MVANEARPALSAYSATKPSHAGRSLVPVKATTSLSEWPGLVFFRGPVSVRFQRFADAAAKALPPPVVVIFQSRNSNMARQVGLDIRLPERDPHQSSIFFLGEGLEYNIGCAFSK